MKQRYSLKSNAVKFRLLTLTLLALFLGGGMKAIGQQPFSLDYTGSADKTYYVTSTDEPAISANNATESGPLAYKFYVSETSNPTSGTMYDHFYKVHVNNASATVTFIFQTTKPVGFSNGSGGNQNAFKVTKGTLKLKLDEDKYKSDITLRRVGTFTTTANTSCPFYLINVEGEASDQKLIIEGLDPEPDSLLYPVSNVKQDTATYLPKRQFVIDGAANITSVNMTTGNPTYTGINTNRKPLFRVETGTLHLTNVTIQNSINSDTDATHGGIYLMLNDNASQNNRNLDVILTHCWLHNIVSYNSTGYPGMGLQWQMRKAHGSGSVVLKRSKFSSLSNPTGQEAAIRATTGCKASVTIDSCNINNNFGGGIRWQGLVADPMQVKNTTIKGNYTKKSGGGIMAKSPLVLTACKILNNTAYEHGGGINYMCYDETGMTVAEAGMIYPNNLELTMDAATIIDGNKTETGNGGGIMVWGRLINLTRTGQMGYVYHEYGPNGNVVGPYQMKVNLNGATIQNNTAHNNGGGIYIVREEDASSYLIDCKLSYGNIKGNKALNGSGGGVCIYQTGTPNPAHVNTDHPAQDIGVYTGGGTNDLTIAENKADQNGGGLYLYAITDGSGWTAVQKFDTKIELNDHTFIQKDSTSNGFGGGVYLHQGNITMNNATIGGSAAELGNYTGNSGGGIYVNSGSATMLSTTIQYNKAENGSGGGMYVGGGDVFINPNEIGTGIRSSISNNTAGQHGGGVYTGNGKLIAYGSFSESGAQSNHIQITNNKASSGNGGGIYCQGASNSQSWEYDIRLRRVTIGNNEAGGSGGGIYLHKGKISVIDGAINGNTATANGGGVYTEEGNIDINATRDERFASEIMGNTAGINGGGLNTHKGYIRIFGTSKDQRIPIANNVATTGSGGGIFCMGEGASNQYITMQHADLINNKAIKGGGNAGTGVVAGCGGGMYLQKGKIAITDVNIQNNYAKNNGGGINNHEGSIDVDGCFIGSSHSDGGSYYCDTTLTYNSESPGNTDRGNEAGNNGGGIYTHKGDIDIEDYIEISGHIFREESKITFNKAGKNGGGINTHQGIIYINKKEQDDQIEISFNKADKGGGMYANAGTIIAYNAIIHDNTATQNGGGANNHSGDIIFYGGSLSNNTAEKGHGGGAYTNVGDIDLFQFPSTNLMNPTLNDGMKVYNNIAKMNGGAFNNHTGRVDVRHATLYNNTSTLGNGGAIFCEGPHANANKGLGYTIRLLCSDVVQNKTRGQDGTATDPTGRGGGIYLKYGSIYSHYSNILNNSANINGGGIDNHDGNILLYGCNVQENQAVTGDGGGIFTYTGDITIGPSTARDGFYNTSKPTIIDHNTAQQDGGGINNQQGNITINGDIVANNEAVKGNGGGVYIADGIINMNGGRIDYNKADQGQGGGVWSGGGEFNIMERDATPDPITLVIDSEVKRNVDQNGNVIPSGEEGAGQTATIHYHLVDQGKYSGVTDVEHGIIWGEGSPNIEVVYGSTSGTAAGYTYKQGEAACQRIIIPAKSGSNPGIEPGKTYYAKAFFRYKSIDGDPVVKTGYSETIEFVTFSSSPLVLSGTVSNITSNSAQGSGKIMDAGDDPNATIKRGVQIWTGSSTPPEPLDENLRPSSDETEFFTVDLRKKDTETDTYEPLTPNTKYYARAYATNDNGATYSYGNTVEFTTLKQTPDMGNHQVIVTTEIVNGVIVATAEFSMPTGTTFGGENGVKAFGFVWSTDDDPELLQDHTVQCSQSSMTNDTTFTASYSPVMPNLTFYVRAYASYIETTVTPTSDITNFSVSEATQHISPSLDGSPVVRANSISGITQNGANIHGQLHYEGSSPVTEYGVVYSPNIQEPAIPTGTATDPKKVSVSGSPGTASEFTVPISGLTPGTTYYLRVYAVNAADTAYSNNFNFTALPVTQPSVVGEAIIYYDTVGHIDHTKVDVVSRIQSDGGADITHYGINYGSQFTTDAQGNTVPDFATGTNIDSTNVAGISSEGLYTITIHPQPNGLIPHTNYWVNSYATNEANLTHTCQWFIFTTNYDKPSVVLDSITNLVTIEGIENNPPTLTGTGNYTVTLAGGLPVLTHGVCWSTFHNPTRNQSDVANTHFRDGTGTISENSSKSTAISQRFPNMKYYARAYVSTATPNDVIDPDNPQNNTYSLNDIVYCNDERAFLTLPIMQSTGASNITSTSATLAGTIASRDPEHYLIKYGVCWGTSENPTPNNNPTNPNYREVAITAASSTTRPFSFNVTGLTPSTQSTTQTYHYRAYAINRNGKAGTDFAFALDSIAYGPDVTFETTQYTITAVALPSAGGTVTGGGGYNHNATCTLDATVTSGGDYNFSGWYCNNSLVTESTQQQFTVTRDSTFEARFNSKVTITAGDNGQVSFDGTNWGTTSNNFYYGTCTVYAQPNTNYEFAGWTDSNGNEVSPDNPYTFTVNGATTLTANFIDSRGRGRSVAPRPRDIYPAPAREPWDWDDDPFGTRDGESTVPTVTTDSITNHTATTAKVYGTVTALGSIEEGAELTAAGIWYSEVGNTYDAVSNRGTFVAASPIPNINAAYTVNLTGLTADKIYYARAYAKNNKVDDYGFGDAISIKFNAPTVTTGAVSDITATSATVKGTVTDKGTANVTAAGIWYSDAGPDYSTDNTGIFVAASSTPAINAEYSVELPGTGNPDLDPSKTYYARAYASNATGIYGFGNAVTFSKNNLVIVTGDITDVTASSATVKCTLMSAGTETVSQIGVWYSTEGPVWDGTTNAGVFTAATGTAVGTEYSVNLTGLTGFNQYVRAYAKVTVNSGGGKEDPTYNYIFGNLATIYTNSPSVSYNTADYGGGIYMTNNDPNNPTKLVFAGPMDGGTDYGKIIYNHAAEAGGGIYIDEYAYMQMKGHCHVNSNHVPAGKKGGGIYLDGILKVGDQPGDEVSAHALQVNLNWAGSEYQETNRNNVYLPNDPDPLPTADENLDAGNKQRVITLLSDISGTYTTGEEPNLVTNYYSKIGLSVDHGYRAVIYTSLTEPNHELWLTRLITDGSLSGAIFDDANLYYALHIHNENNPDDLKPQYDYLYGCWTTVVRANPTGNPEFGEGPHFTSNSYNESEATENETWHIYTKYGLAWFTSYVNGLNGCVAHPDVKAVLEADVDMSEHLWVPIGSVTKAEGTGTGIVFNDGGCYRGEFNGQGYLINGLKCYFVTGIKKYGLFGTVTSDGTHIGKVKNTFVDNHRFYAFKMGETTENAYLMGGIASEVLGNAVISACESRGIMNTPASECDEANTYKGGLVGKMSGEAVIHSSMAMPEMSGQADYTGGLVGQLGASNKLLNSFANPKFPDGSYTMNTNKYVGGLVGENNGLVENCYARLQGDEPTSDGTNSIFGWFAGTSNSGATIQYCYAPRVENENSYVYPTAFAYVKGTQSGTLTGHDNYGTTLRYSGKYGFKHRDHQMKLLPGSTNTYEQAAATGKAGANDTLIGGLQFTLNRWVDEKNAITETTSPYYNKGFADWTRTMASPINDDYPVPMLTDFNSVGSKDGIYLLYEDNINHMWTGGKKFDTVTALHNPNAAMYLYDVQPGDTPDTVKITGNTAVRLYINEEIGITQPANAVLTARAGVTIKNHRKVNDFTDDPNWHLFSSAIEDVPMGLDYHTDTTYSNYTYQPPYDGTKYSTNIPNKPKHSQSIWGNRNYFDPPQTTWWQSDNVGAISYNANGSKIGYFPTNTPYGTWRPGFEGGQHASDPNVGGFFDLYCYSEEFFHWINFKREGSSTWKDHWHMDGDHNQDHWRLDYGYNLPTPTGENPYSFTLGNEPYLLTGKGYMMALSSESMMMADGQLNTGNVYAPVTLTPVGTHCVTPYNYDEPWRTLNLVGNPYQSYLDFLELIADDHNKALLYSDHGEYSYATRDDNNYEFVFYTEEQSANSSELTTSRYIHPHQGFFIKVKDSGNLKFTDDMRVAGTNTSLGSDFRDIDYPLVNLICYEPSGHRNFTTVEVNRPSLGGGSKMQNLRTGYTSIYAHFEDNDYQTLFTPVGVSTVPVWFETEEDGVYTLRWNTLHGYFNYLHLIDHIMGTDIDCLATDEYKFEAKTSDYKSRFRLVFDCVGVEEYEEDDLNSATFAFQMGDELVINGEGMLQMFDVSGRCLMSTRTMGQQSSVSLPKTAAGVYLLRLTTNSEVKVQKMVIK